MTATIHREIGDRRRYEEDIVGEMGTESGKDREELQQHLAGEPGHRDGAQGALDATLRQGIIASLTDEQRAQWERDKLCQSKDWVPTIGYFRALQAMLPERGLPEIADEHWVAQHDAEAGELVEVRTEPDSIDTTNNRWSECGQPFGINEQGLVFYEGPDAAFAPYTCNGPEGHRSDHGHYADLDDWVDLERLAESPEETLARVTKERVDESRRGIVVIGEHQLRAFFGMPDDVRVIAMYAEPATQGIQIIVQSLQLDPVTPGSHAPILHGSWNTDMILDEESGKMYQRHEWSYDRD